MNNLICLVFKFVWTLNLWAQKGLIEQRGSKYWTSEYPTPIYSLCLVLKWPIQGKSHKYSICTCTCTSESRTVWLSKRHLSDTFCVRLSNGKNKMAANHSKAGPDIFSSLDHFGMNKIFFITKKRSRLVSTIWKPDKSESRTWVESESRTMSGFRMYTVDTWKLEKSSFRM
jgi:hypothetical protein